MSRFSPLRLIEFDDAERVQSVVPVKFFAVTPPPSPRHRQRVTELDELSQIRPLTDKESAEMAWRLYRCQTDVAQVAA